MTDNTNLPSEPTGFEKVLGFLGLWIARAFIALLVFTGACYFLGGLDPVIRYAAAAAMTFFLLKEAL